MAQRRMIDKKISVSEQVANLPIEAQLIFTWMIPHADDIGLLPFSPRTLKALVVPMLDITLETFQSHLESMVKENLLEVFQFDESNYYHILKFEETQTLKKDRQPQTILHIDLDKDHKKSWQIVESVVNRKPAVTTIEPVGNQVEPTKVEDITELNGSEVKRTEKENTGVQPAGKKIIKTKNDVASVLGDKYNFQVPQQITAISTPWQEKAFRYATALHIKLPEKLKGRWIKVFKQAHEGRKVGNLDRAYSYLIDYEGNLTDEEKIRYFFHIYENGLEQYQT